MIKCGSNIFIDPMSILGRESKDHDYITTPEGYQKFIDYNKDKILHIRNHKYGYTVFMFGSKPIEIELTSLRKSSALIYEGYKDQDAIDAYMYYMMKMSHRFKKNSPHFKKTMEDIFNLRKYGIHIPPEIKDIYKLRMKETYDYSHPTLAKKKVDFFENNQEGYKKQDYLVYDHDSIHEAIKYYDKPAYDYIKIHHEDVLCSRELFDSQPELIKLATVYEESCVLALERIIIPSDMKADHKKAFLTALEKVCTSISSGWWRDFAWENYYKVIGLYETIGEDVYLKRFIRAKVNNELTLWSDSVKYNEYVQFLQQLP